MTPTMKLPIFYQKSQVILGRELLAATKGFLKSLGRENGCQEMFTKGF
jgi:hypothetical protein